MERLECCTEVPFSSGDKRKVQSLVNELNQAVEERDWWRVGEIKEEIARVAIRTLSRIFPNRKWSTSEAIWGRVMCLAATHEGSAIDIVGEGKEDIVVAHVCLDVPGSDMLVCPGKCYNLWLVDRGAHAEAAAEKS